jgi:hypothetical protein
MNARTRTVLYIMSGLAVLLLAIGGVYAGVRQLVTQDSAATSAVWRGSIPAAP